MASPRGPVVPQAGWLNRYLVGSRIKPQLRDRVSAHVPRYEAACIGLTWLCEVWAA